MTKKYAFRADSPVVNLPASQIPGLNPLISCSPFHKKAEKALDRLVRRAKPERIESLDRLSDAARNPNMAFHVYIYEPLKREASRLADTYQNDYLGLKEHLLDEGDIGSRGAEAIATPTPIDWIPGTPPIGWIPSMVPVIADLAASRTWKNADHAERTRMAYYLLLRKLEIDMERPGYGSDGGEENSVLSNYLLGESRKQENWEKTIYQQTGLIPERYAAFLREPDEPPTHAWVRTVIIPKEETPRPRPTLKHSVRPHLQSRVSSPTTSLPYKFKRGETVWGKSASFGYDDPREFVRDFKKANPGVNPNLVFTHQTYNMPYRGSPAPNPPPPTKFAPDPLKQAVRRLESTPVKPIVSPRPFDSTIDLLGHMEQEGLERERSNRWLQDITKQYSPKPATSIDPIRQASDQLGSSFQQPHSSFRPFPTSTIDLLGQLEHQATERENTNRWLSNLNQQYGRPTSFNQPDPLRQAMDQWKKTG